MTDEPLIDFPELYECKTYEQAAAFVVNEMQMCHDATGPYEYTTIKQDRRRLTDLATQVSFWNICKLGGIEKKAREAREQTSQPQN